MGDNFQPLNDYRKLPQREMKQRAVQFCQEMRRRRSVRDFSDQAIDRSIIEACLRAAASAPSGANQQPCICSYLTDPNHECSCTPQQIQKYRFKISGPLMDRIDIHVEVPAVPYKDLIHGHRTEKSETIRERFVLARQRQTERFADTKVYCNAQMSNRLINRYCVIDKASEQLLEKAIETLGLSARAFHRILKIARTIADLEGKDNISIEHISEAVQYRSLDRK